MDALPKIHKCPHDGCTATFNRPYRLEQHLYTHCNIRAFSCKEKDCDKSYTSKSHLDRHIRTSHQQKQTQVIYSCPKCMKTYCNRQNLKRHLSTTHTHKLKCDICQKEFLKKTTLSAHMFEHAGVKPFSCEICGNEFVNITDKNKHLRNHKLYTCSICSTEFREWNKLQAHMKLDHEVPEYICNDCGKVFKKRSRILRHLKIHEQNKVFMCYYPDCGRFYSRVTNLRQHIKVKHKNLTYNCTLCPSKLSSQAKLNYHMNLHTGVGNPRQPPKTLQTGRRERLDKGISRKGSNVSIAKKLAGITQEVENEKVNDGNHSPLFSNEIISDVNAMLSAMEQSQMEQSTVDQ